MSNLASAAAALPGVPEDLLQRSAEARAAASGGSAEDILASWAGGEPAPKAPAPEEPTPQAPAQAPQATAPVETQTTPAGTVAVQDAPPTADLGIIKAAEVEQEPDALLEPAPTLSRLKKGHQLGLGFGLAAGLVALFLGLLMFTPSLAVVDGVVVGLVAPRKIVFGMAILMGAAGWLVADAVARVPAAIDKTYFLDGPSRDVKITGVVTGLALGIVLGTLIKKSGTADLLDPSLFTLPLMSSLVTGVLGAGVIGAITGVLVQLVGLPDSPGIEDEH